MHFARAAAVLLALLASLALATGCGAGSDDEFYQYRTVTYAISVVGPHDTFNVWYWDGRHLREEHPTSTEWQLTVTGKFYSPADLELHGEAHAADDDSPFPTKVGCSVAVDGKKYEESSYTHSVTCSVDFDEVKTAPRPAPAAANSGGSSFGTLALWLGAAVLTAIVVARWVYVRRRKSRGTWPAARG